MQWNQFYEGKSHPQWYPIIEDALNCMDADYLMQLLKNTVWLPGSDSLFSALSMPLANVKYVLMGESPYPRAHSANGYAFWDQAVQALWSDTGLSKQVNTATSLRNIIKMLLKARGDLGEDCSQSAIAQIDKNSLVQTATQFFTGMMNKGILLLNASLVYEARKVPYHARHWRPFMQSLLEQLAVALPQTELILLGKIADVIPTTSLKVGLRAEHPYNLSFISNSDVLQFFNPLDLLSYEHR